MRKQNGTALIAAGLVMLLATWQPAAGEPALEGANVVEGGYRPPPMTPEERDRGNAYMEVASLAHDGDFAGVDALAAAWRTSRQRTPSGIWHLAVLYQTVIGFQPHLIDPVRVDVKAAREQLQRWMAEAPDSPVPVIVLAFILQDDSRSRYEPGLPPDTPWMEPAEYERLRIAEMRRLLEEHKATASIDPNWYRAMVYVAAQQDWPDAEFMALIDEAMAREPAYYDTYFAAATARFPLGVPGNRQRLERFVRYVTRRTATTEGTMLYARIYWAEEQFKASGKLFWLTDADWPLMRQGFDELVQRHPGSWNRAAFAKFACLARDRETTRRVIATLGADHDAAVWNYTWMRDTCTAWANEAPVTDPVR